MRPHPLLAGIEEIRSVWGWFLALGVLLLGLGFIALSAPWLIALSTILLFGWLLLLGGVMEVVSAAWARRWSGFFLHLVTGLLDGVVGLLIVSKPDRALDFFTLMLAVFFLVGGLFRATSAVVVQFPNWGWALLGGVVSFLLGLMIWAQWPESSAWVIGTLLGIELIFRGWSWVMFALAARRLPGPTA
jgi:uncharacterized membrane protein HdeD (DUF308 family)